MKIYRTIVMVTLEKDQKLQSDWNSKVEQDLL